jgi:two-component system sensor histidine kinase CiaH
MMFRKLKIQFILINIAIITFLFISLTTGSYILLQINMINHADIFAKRMTDGINSGLFPGPSFAEDIRERRKNERPPADPYRPPLLQRDMAPPAPPPIRLPALPDGKKNFPAVFFVKIDSGGKITFKSKEQPLELAQLNLLAGKVRWKKKPSGLIGWEGNKLHYYKTRLKKETDTLIIFQDMHRDQGVQRSLVISLSIAGIIYLLLALAGSLYMAERVIAPIKEAWQQQRDFLADASHELRTPLAVIQTNLEVIQGAPEETVAEQKEWLNTIQEELEQMKGLVGSLLFLARTDSHQYVMDRKPVCLDQLVLRVNEAFKPVAAAGNITLGADVQPEIKYNGDESHLRQLLQILLENAIRHTPAGGKILIGLRNTEKRILLSVADTGEGIAPEHLEKIFDRFYQADTSRSKGKSGLGLSIAKSIVENHGGAIQATSRPGVGSTFTVELPNDG